MPAWYEMPSLISKCVAIAILMTLLVVGVLSFPVIERQKQDPDPGPEHAARTLKIIITALEAEELMLRHETFRLSQNTYLQSSLEDFDNYAAEQVLKATCKPEAFIACEAFDGDGDPIAQLYNQDGMEKLAKPSLETLRAADPTPHDIPIYLERHGKAYYFVSLAAVGNLGEDTGYVRIFRTLDRRLAAKLKFLTGMDIAFQAATGEILSASLSAENGAPLSPISAANDANIHTVPFSKISQIKVDFPVNMLLLKPAIMSPKLSDHYSTILAVLALIFLGCLSIYFVIKRELAPFYAYAKDLEHWLSLGTESQIPQFSASGNALLDRLNKVTLSLLNIFRVSSQEARTAANAIEHKIHRISDLLTIDAGAFRMFKTKVLSLATLCQTDIKNFASYTPEAYMLGITQLLRHVHTIKSNARLFNMNRVHHAARDFEDTLIKERELHRTGEPASTRLSPEQLMTHLNFIVSEVDSYNELRVKILGDEATREVTASKSMVKLYWFSSLFSRILMHLKSPRLSSLQLSSIVDEYAQASHTVGREDIADYLPRYDFMLAEIAQKLGKSLHPLELTGNCRFFPYEHMEHLNDVLVHCLRNAVDHGIEPRNKRLAAGKAEKGRIVIDSRLVSGLCMIRIKDDGRGISRQSVVAKCVERGFFSPIEAERMSDEEIFSYIFESGFSTARLVTDVSGRGVGMDVVRDTLHKLGGDVSIKSTPGEGLEVNLYFPMPASRFESRLSLFNLYNELISIAEVLKPHCKATSLRITAKPHVQKRALAFCDRLMFGETLSELLRMMLVYVDKPAEIKIELDHAMIGNELCSLDSYTLSFLVRSADGSLQTGFWSSIGIDDPTSDLAERMFACGMYTLSDPNNGTLTIQIHAGVEGSLICAPLPILILTKDESAIATMLEKQCKEHFGAAQLEVMKNKDHIQYFLKHPEARDGLIVIDELHISDDLVKQALKPSLANGHHDRNVVIIAENLASNNLQAVFELSGTPLLVQEVLDANTATQALEHSFTRLLLSRLDSKAAIGLEGKISN